MCNNISRNYWTNNNWMYLRDCEFVLLLYACITLYNYIVVNWYIMILKRNIKVVKLSWS